MDISLLANFKNLKELNLNENRIKDLTPLKSLRKLEKLYLSSNAGGIQDTSFLTTMPKLKMLDMSGNNLKMLPDISSLKSLSRLHLGRNSIVSSEDFKNLTRLEFLDISPLAGLTSLERLELSGKEKPGGNAPTLIAENAAALSKLTKLISLSLDNTLIRDISAFADLTALERLTLSKTQASDISVLSTLPSLKTLVLNQSGVSQAECLKVFPKPASVPVDRKDPVALRKATHSSACLP